MNGAAISVTPEQSADSGQSRLWQQHLKMLGVATFVIFALFWRDASDMAATWWNVSTYNHCLLILPILGWQVHQRWPELQKITPAVWSPGLGWIALGSIGWLLGEAAGVSLARHLGLVMMLQGAVVTLLGLNVAKGLQFVLFYSFFLVPFGEEFVPLLQTITADLSMLFLSWASIPAFIDGVFISTPTGYFEVAEACSGVKFLIAMVAYGALVSNICFQSWQRRTIFMIMAVTVPIIANGIRAFGTIYIAHHTSTDFATGFDHIFYGWFFFAFVLLLVMIIGWPFFDRKIDDALINGEALERAAVSPSRLSALHAFLATALIVVAPVMWLAATSAQSTALPERIALPQVPGWEIVAYEPAYDWKPRFDGADHQLLGTYRRTSDGQTVDLAVAVFASQEDGREVVGYGQGAFDPDTEWAWSRNLPDVTNAHAEQIVAPGPVVRDVLSYYRIGDKLTGSGSAVKLETLKLRLLGGNQHAVAILVSAERDSDEGPRQKMIDFTKALGSIDKLADELAGLR